MATKPWCLVVFSLSVMSQRLSGPKKWPYIVRNLMSDDKRAGLYEGAKNDFLMFLYNRNKDAYMLLYYPVTMP